MATKDILFSCWFFLLLDSVTLLYSRSLLLDFLCGNTSHHLYLKLHKRRTRIDRLTMGYIRNQLKNSCDLRPFSFYHVLYWIELISIIPQYAFLIVSLFLNASFWKILFFVISLFKLVLLLIFRMPSWPGQRSQYAYKSGNRKKNKK